MDMPTLPFPQIKLLMGFCSDGPREYIPAKFEVRIASPVPEILAGT